jgi:hypothetical protein
LLVLLLDVLVFNLLHELPAFEEVGLEAARNFTRGEKKLVICHFLERDGATGWNHERAPLKHQSGIPKYKSCEYSARRSDEGPGVCEPSTHCVEKNSATKDEENGQRNKSRRLP